MNQSAVTQPPHAPQPPAAAPAAAPTWPEYLLMLLGIGISLVLTELVGLEARATDRSPPWLIPPLLRAMPYLFFLPLGLLLWWPAFFTVGRLRGRAPELSAVEWLWGLLWGADLFLVGLIVWYYLNGLPDFLSLATFKSHAGPALRFGLWALPAVGVFLASASLLQRRHRPWTHHFGVALLIWPAAPLAVIWLGEAQIDLR